MFLLLHRVSEVAPAARNFFSAPKSRDDLLGRERERTASATERENRNRHRIATEREDRDR